VGATLFDRLDAAVSANDTGAVVAVARELSRNRNQLARLTGSYEPSRVTVGTADAEQQCADIGRLLAELLAHPDSRAALLLDAHPLPVIDAELAAEPEAEPEAEPPRWWQFADQTRPPEPEPAPVPELADPVPPVVVGPPLSRRVSERREYDPLRGWEPGRRPINGG
jgi:hypothetical protein